MEFGEIKKRALEIRAKYEEYEIQRNGKPWNNERIMEGFVVDVGDLMKLIMVKEGARDGGNVDEKLAHELSDCLWSIIILADKYNIDLEKAFVENMQKIEENFKNHKD
jgi:NTP pyrophosphatase (non-canonical NTP hydrolase)